jgi:hypothetical protein
MIRHTQSREINMIAGGEFHLLSKCHAGGSRLARVRWHAPRVTVTAPGARPREIGDECAAGIGSDGGQRSFARTKAETMQGESGLQLCVRTGICRHGVTSDATA